MAYTIRLAVFEGPLDLLLHLIRAQKLDIYDIPIASVTEQYLEHLSLMEELNLEVAGEFLVMAATLMEIKSRMLLPRPPRELVGEDEGPDPREELVRRLIEYEQYRGVAENLRLLERESRRSFARAAPDDLPSAPLEEMTPRDLLGALRRMLLEATDGNGKGEAPVQIRRETVSLQSRIDEVWQQISQAGVPVLFSAMLPPHQRTRRQIIVSFLALLELLKEGKIQAWQEGGTGEITLTLAA